MNDFVQTRVKQLSEKEFAVIRTQDIESILDQNKIDQATNGYGYSENRDLKHVARIPLVVLELWAKEAGIPRNECFGPKMNDIIKRKLNDPDNKLFRTGMGQV